MNWHSTSLYDSEKSWASFALDEKYIYKKKFRTELEKDNNILYRIIYFVLVKNVMVLMNNIETKTNWYLYKKKLAPARGFAHVEVVYRI